MKTSKILISLLLLSQVMVAGPGKDKTSFVFKKFETPYPEHSPERISSLALNELYAMHRALHPHQSTTFLSWNMAQKMLMEDFESNKHDRCHGEFSATAIYTEKFEDLGFNGLGALPFYSLPKLDSFADMIEVIAAHKIAEKKALNQINNNSTDQTDNK